MFFIRAIEGHGCACMRDWTYPTATQLQAGSKLNPVRDIQLLAIPARFAWSDKIFGWHDALLGKMTVWTGARILHLNSPLAYSFCAGDSLFGWVMLILAALLASLVLARRANRVDPMSALC